MLEEPIRTICGATLPDSKLTPPPHGHLSLLAHGVGSLQASPDNGNETDSFGSLLIVAMAVASVPAPHRFAT